MQLPLNFAVLYISKSVALNNQDEIYTTLATTKQGFLDSFLTGFRGSKNTHSYTPYNFRLAPQKIFGPYGDFLEDYWWCIYKFVKSIIERLEIDFLDFKDWSNNLAFMIPGFPSFEEIQNAETFTRVITSFIHNVSVEHSADHYSYASYSPLKVPLRLRKNYQHNEKHFYVKGEDYVRHKLADEMFFKTYTLKKLIDVTYNFPIELNQEVKIFKENLKLVDNKWKNQFIPLNDIATSIQY